MPRKRKKPQKPIEEQTVAQRLAELQRQARTIRWNLERKEFKKQLEAFLGRPVKWSEVRRPKPQPPDEK